MPDFLKYLYNLHKSQSLSMSTRWLCCAAVCWDMMVTRGCMRLTDEGQLPATPAQHQPHPSQQPPTLGLGRITRPSSAKCHRCWAGYKFAAKYLRGELERKEKETKKHQHFTAPFIFRSGGSELANYEQSIKEQTLLSIRYFFLNLKIDVW